MFSFFFWLFLAGILVASLQDLKRREVDNWLNLFLIISGFSFLIFQAIFDWDYEIIFLGILSFLVMFGLACLFYYGRIFAGGDSKLLFAMFAVFVGANFSETILNIVSFIAILMMAGGMWGVGWLVVLCFINFKKIKIEIIKQCKNIYFKSSFLLGIILLVFSYTGLIFLYLSIFVLAGSFLLVFARAVEKKVMIEKVSPKDLREGDWLVNDVVVGRKKIKASWEGLSKDDLRLLRKSKKKVLVKQGLPFVPGFLIGFLIWCFFKNWFLNLIFGI